MWARYGTNGGPVWEWADINGECPTFLSPTGGPIAYLKQYCPLNQVKEYLRV